MAHTVSRDLTDETLNRIMAIESRGKLRAKAKTSSALGPFQFLNGTFIDTVKAHRPDLFHGRTTAQVLALRTDPTIGIELGARFTEDNARGLGAGYTDGDLYLAHFLGLGMARKFKRANQNALAADIAGSQAVHANPTILSKPKTVAGVRRWAQASMVHRWEEAGHVDWVKQYYDASSPLAHASDEDHEVLDHNPPVKHEENFQREEAPEEPEHEEVHERHVDPEPNESFVETAKSMFKSKIAWIAGLLGFGSVGSGASSDPDMAHLLLQLVQKPMFLFILAAIVAAGAIIYFRWRDHGKGAVR